MKECEIRPKEIFDRYLQLSYEDALTMQDNKNQFIDIDCPACSSAKKSKLYNKNDFEIQKCEECNSIYCSPRPSKNQLDTFYATSPSAHYWAKEFFPTVAEVRREKMFRPKAEQILALCCDKSFKPQSICDIGAGLGLLLEEIGKILTGADLLAVELSEESAQILREKGFEVLEKSVEDAVEWKEKSDLVTCFEVIEHVFNPKEFIAAIYSVVKPQGYCLITGLGGDGFDVQTLGEHSKSIFPPHHLNFLSVEGLEKLFSDVGFTDVEVTTPGKLDVDIVKNTLEEKGLPVPEFLKILFDRGQKTCDQFQNFLVSNKLSSHVWILAKKG